MEYFQEEHLYIVTEFQAFKLLISFSDVWCTYSWDACPSKQKKKKKKNEFSIYRPAYWSLVTHVYLIWFLFLRLPFTQCDPSKGQPSELKKKKICFNERIHRFSFLPFKPSRGNHEQSNGHFHRKFQL